jgi:hypothetical protein
MQLGRDDAVLKCDDRDVVARAVLWNHAPDRLQTRVIRRGRVTQQIDQSVDSLADFGSAALHEPVGVEHEHLAGGKRDLHLEVASI